MSVSGALDSGEKYGIIIQVLCRRYFQVHVYQKPKGTTDQLEGIHRCGGPKHQGIRNEIQGRPQPRLQKSYQFQVPKTNPKLAPCTCLFWSWQSFPFCYVDELGDAWPRPRLGRKTYWDKDKASLTGLETILLLQSQQGWTWSSW